MPFESPAPGRIITDVSKQADIVELRIAHMCSSRALDFTEDRLELHDRSHAPVCRGAESRGDEIEGQMPLAFVHLRNTETASWSGHITPVCPFRVIVELELGDGSLLWRETVDKAGGRLRHSFRRFAGSYRICYD